MAQNENDRLDARTKLFVQLLNVRRDEGMTRAYMAMKSSEMLNGKSEKD